MGQEDSNNFTLSLGQQFHYVHSIELIDGYVPSSGYTISQHNNTLYWQETDPEIIRIELISGSYTIKTLLKTLSDMMTQHSPNHHTYKCRLDPITRHVSIESTHHFNLIWTDNTETVGERGTMETLVVNPESHRKELRKVETGDQRRRYITNSIRQVLGFKPINLEGSRQYVGQMVYHLQPYQYLGIFVNTENSDDFKKVIAPSPDRGVDGLLRLSHYKGTHIIKLSIIAGFITTFNPPINFNKIRIQYRTMDGQLYDFNGLENQLLFEVRSVFNRASLRDAHDLS